MDDYFSYITSLFSHFTNLYSFYVHVHSNICNNNINNNRPGSNYSARGMHGSGLLDMVGGRKRGLQIPVHARLGDGSKPRVLVQWVSTNRLLPNLQPAQTGKRLDFQRGLVVVTIYLIFMNNLKTDHDNVFHVLYGLSILPVYHYVNA